MVFEDVVWFGCFGLEDVFDVDVVDLIGEVVNEVDVVDVLVVEVVWIVVEVKGWMVVKYVQCVFGGDDVEGDFGWVDFEGEVYVESLVFVYDWFEVFGKFFEICIDCCVGDWWKVVEQVLDWIVGEVVDDVYIECFGGVCCCDQFVCCVLLYIFRIVVVLDVCWENGFVVFVDVIVDGLIDEMV